MWSIQLYYNMDFWGILIQCHKDLVKIVRWDLSNYHALKAGFNRFNYHMFCFRATRKVTIQTSQLNLWGFGLTKSSATEPSHQAIWWQPPGVAAPSYWVISETKRAQLYDESISLFGSHPEAGRYGVVTRNDRRRPWKSWSTRWGWNFFALEKKQLGMAYGINIQYKLLDFLYSCFVLLEPGYANIILPQAPFAYNVGR